MTVNVFFHHYLFEGQDEVNKQVGTGSWSAGVKTSSHTGTLRIRLDTVVWGQNVRVEIRDTDKTTLDAQGRRRSTTIWTSEWNKKIWFWFLTNEVIVPFLCFLYRLIRMYRLNTCHVRHVCKNINYSSSSPWSSSWDLLAMPAGIKQKIITFP